MQRSRFQKIRQFSASRSYNNTIRDLENIPFVNQNSSRFNIALGGHNIFLALIKMLKVLMFDT